MKQKKETEFLSVEDAINLAKTFGLEVSPPTVRKWCRSEDSGGYSLGHQLGGKYGKWAVNAAKFKEFLHGKIQTGQ